MLTVVYCLAISSIILGLVYWAWRAGLHIGTESGREAGVHVGTATGLKIARDALTQERERYRTWWYARSDRERDCGDPEHVFENRLAGFEMAMGSLPDTLRQDRGV